MQIVLAPNLSHLENLLLQEGVRLFTSRTQQGISTNPDYTAMVLWSCAVVQHMDWTSIAFLFDRIWAVSPTSLQGATRNQVYFAYLMFLLSYRQHLLRTAVGTDGVTGGDGVTAKTLTPAMRELMEHPMLGPDLQAGTPGSTKGGEAAVDADAAVLVVLESLLSAVAAETGHSCPVPFMPQHYRKQYTATFASFKHDINTSFFQSDVFRLLKVSTPPGLVRERM
jgi:hypothetical protein